jgi:hypothetical protein
VTGLAVGDIVVVNPPAQANSCGMVAARVSAANTLSLQFISVKGSGNCTPTAGTYTVLAFR